MKRYPLGWSHVHCYPLPGNHCRRCQQNNVQGCLIARFMKLWCTQTTKRGSPWLAPAMGCRPSTDCPAQAASGPCLNPDSNTTTAGDYYSQQQKANARQIASSRLHVFHTHFQACCCCDAVAAAVLLLTTRLQLPTNLAGIACTFVGADGIIGVHSPFTCI